MDRKKDIIKCINSISGRYSAYEVFTDWIRCSALFVSNSIDMVHGEVWKEREAAFSSAWAKYTPGEREDMAGMFLMLAETLEDKTEDVLGQIYMESGMGSKTAGQFFTPYHISVLNARLSMQGAVPDERGIYSINEPSCGGGGMIIAAAQALKDKGVNYRKYMDVVAQDLDWKGVHMCYLQLSLLGIKAVCVQGDSLAEPYIKGKYPQNRVLYTPAKAGVLI